MIPVAVVVLAVYGLFRAVVMARTVLLLGFLAVVLAAVVGLLVDLLDRVMPRSLAVVLVGAAILVASWGFGRLVAPVVVEQGERLVHQLDEVRDDVDAWWKAHVGGRPLTGEVTTQAPQAVAQAVPVAVRVVEVGFTLVLLLVLSLFLAGERDRLHSGLRRLLPDDAQPVFDECWRRVGGTLRRWTLGILVAMVSMGVFTAVGLYIAGIELPLLLGFLTFLGTFVPYAGAIASAVPGLAIALAQSPRHFLSALVVYGLVHVVEGYLVEPLIMHRAVKLQPALLLFWQALMGAVFGVVGVIAATPLLATAQVLVDYLWVERRLGRTTSA